MKVKKLVMKSSGQKIEMESSCQKIEMESSRQVIKDWDGVKSSSYQRL